jgi:hypothetical protein
MKLSPNFDVREFVSPDVYNKFGSNSIWFVDKRIVDIAEFYKSFFFEYYKKRNGDSLKSVSIVVNNWHYGGHRKWSGLRTPDCGIGASMSQHKFKSGFDCEIILKFKDGCKVEANYIEIHKAIQDNEELFLSKGVTTVEDVKIATGWLHTDIRWIKDQTKIKIVGG